MASFDINLDIDSFDCDDPDLNEFFIKDALPYQLNLMGKTHAFVADVNPSTIVSAFTVSNDSLRLDDKSRASRKKAKEVITEEKVRWGSYPAVKIGRLGVDRNYWGKGIGSQVLDFIKGWFANIENKTGCRFVIVDAYNNENALAFYAKNGFDFLFNDEKEELEYINIGRRKPFENLNTRFMYFDLIRLDAEDTSTD